MNKFKFLVTLCMCTMLMLFCSCTSVYAKDLDSLNNQNSSTNQESNTKGGSKDTGDESFDSISDYMRGHESVTQEDMSNASKMASPLTALIGKGIGLILLITNSLVFFITALDLMYIAVPFTRRFLNPSNIQQGGGMLPGMGMSMGGGAGMGASGGSNPSAHKWVSDEAVAALMEGGQRGAQGGVPMGGGMGMGMGMSSMGGMGGMQQQSQPQSTKSIISIYFKKRVFFLVVFAIASTLLMSSIFTDCGLNIAELFYKIMEMFNGGISNVDL